MAVSFQCMTKSPTIKKKKEKKIHYSSIKGINTDKTTSTVTKELYKEKEVIQTVHKL